MRSGATRPPEPERAELRPEQDPEVVAKPKRRQFTAEYRLRILEEAERCTQPGEVGRLLRREGLYTSHLAAWRKARRQGSLRGLAPNKLDLRKRPTYAREGVGHLWFVDPVVRMLEAFELHEEQWLLIAIAQDDEPVSIAPFDAITFSLGKLWD